MRITDVVSRLEVGMEESQNQRDQRVEDLWRKLDPQGVGELDWKGLQKGLRRIDHPLKNADDMLKEIIKIVDTNGDGKIQYEEFRVFVEAAERQLLLLFRSIDKNHDGQLNIDELRAAFQRAGLAVPLRRLSGFFDEIDMNHDGLISFEEWRDFLLFMPAHDSGSALEAALSYYSSMVTLNAEGDSNVSEETLEGLGTTGFLLQALFGSLLKIAYPDQNSPPRPPPPTTTSGDFENTTPATFAAQSAAAPPLSEIPESATMVAVSAVDYFHERAAAAAKQPSVQEIHKAQQQAAQAVKTKLTDLLPEPGYFLAGAVSGGVSRTATAPLDRLKVYLLVNTKVRSDVTIEAAKHGHPLAALRNATKPIGEAVLTLWKTGGFRNFFAGNGLNVLKIMPESSIRFGSYEASKRWLAAYEGHNDPKQISMVSRFVAGGLGGMIAQAAVYPLDTLKFRLQCETVEGGLKGNALLIRTAKNLWRDGGARAAYRGLTIGIVGMFPYSAVDMGTFEFLKKQIVKHKARYYGMHEEDVELGNVSTAVLGASSGALGASIVYPLNVLRTRLQTQGTAMHPPTYTGIWDVARRTVKNEGVRGLYKGLTPNLLKVAPALSITWVTYENMKKVLNLK